MEAKPSPDPRCGPSALFRFGNSRLPYRDKQEQGRHSPEGEREHGDDVAHAPDEVPPVPRRLEAHSRN